MTTGRSLPTALLALALVIAGCGGDDADAPIEGAGQQEVVPTDGAAGDDGPTTVEVGGVAVELSGPVNDEGTAAVDGGSATIGMEGFAFVPTFLTGGEGAITVEVENTTQSLHTFTIERQGIDEVLDPGERVEVEVSLPDDGSSLEFVCRLHTTLGHRGAFVPAASNHER